MKVVILFLLISVYGYAQRVDSTKSGTIFTTNINLSAGKELQLSSRHFYTGTIIIAGSSLIGSSMLLGEDPQPTIAAGIAGIGTIIGIGFMIESHIHLKKAGIILDRNGIGIAYHF